MSERTRYGNLQVSQELDNFLRNEVVPGIDVDPKEFWQSFEKILDEFGPRNRELLKRELKYRRRLTSGILNVKDLITTNKST